MQQVGTPDLIVGSPSASDSGPVAGVTFTLRATVRNLGDGASAATTLRYYRSTDATITTSDTEVGTDAVAELAPAGGGSEAVDLTAPASPGTYYYGACVDAVTDESDTTNNCSTSLPVTVQITVTEPEGHPDLVVAAPTVSDSGPAAGATFTLSATVRNEGEGESAATTLRYYRSTDATITASDTAVGTDAVAELAPAGGGSEAVDLTAPASPGTYYYGACVDTVTDESDTDQQLLGIGDGQRASRCDGAGGPSGLGGVGTDGERQRTSRWGVVHPVGDGEERWRRSLGGHDTALLPLDRRDDHDIRHGGGDGRGSGACRFGKQ